MAELSTLIPNLNEIREEHAQPEGEVHLEPTGEVHPELQRRTDLRNNWKFNQLQGSRRERERRGSKKKKRTTLYQKKPTLYGRSTMQERGL